MLHHIKKWGKLAQMNRLKRLSAAKRASEKNPRNGKVYMLGEAYSELGQLERAKENFYEALDIIPNHFNTNSSSRLFIKEQNFMRACDYLKNASKLAPNDTELHIILEIVTAIG